MSHELTVSVIGPLQVLRAGRVVEVGGRKERRVLAVLAAAGGRAVTVDEMIEALWGDEPPRTAERGVHAFVARLRRTLEPDRRRGASSEAVVTEGRGYRLSM